MHSESIINLIKNLKRLPSVGERTAERFVFHWLSAGKGEVAELRAALNKLLLNTKSCKICWNFSDTDPCPVCADKKRDHASVCVVAEPQSIPALEKTGVYHGVYHVLRGALEMESEENAGGVKIKELLKRIKGDPGIKEVILSLNPDLPGETTMLYLEKIIKKINPRLKISRLARGLPMGGDLQYADEITLGSALKNRTASK